MTPTSALFPKMVAAGHHELRQGRRGNFKCDKMYFCFNYSRSECGCILMVLCTRMLTLVSVALAGNSLIEWSLNQTNPVVRRPKYLCAILTLTLSCVVNSRHSVNNGCIFCSKALHEIKPTGNLKMTRLSYHTVKLFITGHEAV